MTLCRMISEQHLAESGKDSLKSPWGTTVIRGHASSRRVELTRNLPIAPMHLLFPSDPFDKSTPDASYAEEVDAFRALGWSVSLFSFEDFEQGSFRPRPVLPDGATIVYRGWMLTPEQYNRLDEAIKTRGAVLNTAPEHYQLCHYLPGWYELCRDLTIPTVFASEHSDFPALLKPLGWQKYFVKDFVKSLTTARGSVASTIDEVGDVVTLLRQYRGQIEGGVCIREFMSLQQETEERYFVFNGVAHGREGETPQIVHEVARRIPSPFFSVDIIETEAEGLIVIELGDGQVSDRKKWPANRFARVASTFNPLPRQSAAQASTID